MVTPRPTWNGFVPPSPCGLGWVAGRSVWEMTSLNTHLLALKAVVFTLATLFPMMSSAVLCACTPDTPLNIA